MVLSDYPKSWNENSMNNTPLFLKADHTVLETKNLFPEGFKGERVVHDQMLISWFYLYKHIFIPVKNKKQSGC